MEELESTAYHEAGHAVAAIAQGLNFETVTIEADQERESLGSMIHTGLMMYDSQNKRDRRALAREMILMVYAGYEAERIASPNADEEQSAGDFDAAFELSREYGVLPRSASFVGDDNHVNYLMRLKRESGKIVQSHWTAVRLVAEALSQQKTLTKQEIIHLIGD